MCLHCWSAPQDSCVTTVTQTAGLHCWAHVTVHLGKDRKFATPTMTANHTTVAGLTRRIENLGHKLYMDNFFYLMTCTTS
jgi:hypothetical protein